MIYSTQSSIRNQITVIVQNMKWFPRSICQTKTKIPIINMVETIGTYFTNCVLCFPCVFEYTWEQINYVFIKCNSILVAKL